MERGGQNAQKHLNVDYEWLLFCESSDTRDPHNWGVLYRRFFEFKTFTYFQCDKIWGVKSAKIAF